MEWLNTILQGILLGGLYAMFAAGLSLIFGVMRLVNIAHGDLIVLAAYVALVTTQALGIDPLLSLIVVVPVMAAIGYGLQRALLNRTLGDDLLPPLLVTFGLSVIIQNGLLELFTADSVKLNAGAVEIESIAVGGGLAIGVLPLIQFVLAVMVIAGLQWLFYRTALGRAFRATSDDQPVAQLMGLNNAHVFGLAMALSLAIVAVAGVLLAVRTNFDPSIGPARLIFGFEAVIIGGLGSMWGTLAGGIILGVAQAVGAQLDPGWNLLAGHIAFLVVLALRPAGPVPQGAGMSGEISVQHSNWSSRIGTTIVLLAFMALIAAPFWADRADLRLLAEIYAYVALASLWNLLAGYAGLVSVGQQAYVGLGAYVLFGLATLGGVNPLAAIPIAGAAAAIVSVPVAALMFRLRGHYFAIGTWVVAEVFRLLAAQTSALGGGSGTSLPAAVVIAIASSRQMREFVIYWIALAQVAAILLAIVWLLRSRYGLALTAIRDNELGARSNGIDVMRIKYAVYVAVAFGTAMVGALIFLQKIRISPDTAFSVNDWTAFVIFITVIGGIGRIEGPIIGTVIFFLLRQTLADLGAIYLLILGVVAIAVMLKAPKGLWGLIADRFGWQVFPLERRLVIPKR